MESKKKSVLLIYPEALTNNPGATRVNRMIRSFASVDKKVVLLTKGTVQSITKTVWGTLLTTESQQEVKTKEKKNLLPTIDKTPSKLSSLKSLLANFFLCPDAGLWWCYKVMKVKEFESIFSGCHTVLSTSPPHSTHLLALSLAKKYDLKWVMDMRDGWLDEPLKQTVFFLKPLEKFQEKKCVNSCDLVLTNNSHWQNKLSSRFFNSRHKIKVLMNSMDDRSSYSYQMHGQNVEKYLLYTGSFRLSDKRRKVKFLLEPLIECLLKTPLRKILLLGNFNQEDLDEINSYQRLYKLQLKIEYLMQVPREQIYAYLVSASGLLLTSNSHCALPSKFFDYLSVGKPILSFCLRGSSLDRITKGLNFVCSTSINNPEKKIVQNFLDLVTKGTFKEPNLSSFKERNFRHGLLKYFNRLES